MEKISSYFAPAGSRLPPRILVTVRTEQSLLLLLRLLRKEVENTDLIAKVNTAVFTVFSHAVNMNTHTHTHTNTYNKPGGTRAAGCKLLIQKVTSDCRVLNLLVSEDSIVTLSTFVWFHHFRETPR